MPDPDLLIRIDENVKYLVKARGEDKAAFETHVKKDEQIISDYIKPLWEQRQQDIGAAQTRKVGSTAMGFLINAAIATFTAWATIKAIK